MVVVDRLRYYSLRKERENIFPYHSISLLIANGFPWTPNRSLAGASQKRQKGGQKKSVSIERDSMQAKLSVLAVTLSLLHSALSPPTYLSQQALLSHCLLLSHYAFPANGLVSAWLHTPLIDHLYKVHKAHPVPEAMQDSIGPWI